MTTEQAIAKQTARMSVEFTVIGGAAGFIAGVLVMLIVQAVLL